MENKYDMGFWKFEQKHKEEAKLINRELNNQFKFQKENEIFEKDYLNSICLNFHLYSTKLKQWIIKTVLPFFTNETLITYYLMYLTDSLMVNDKEKLNRVMSSIKEIGLIKDIKLNNNKINLITNDNEEINLKNIFDDVEVRQQFKNRCHSGCEFLIRNDSNLSEGSYIITIRDRFICKKPIYHSVILNKKGYIIDPARNMMMKLEDYKKLLKPQAIMCMTREQMLEEIERLKETDQQFNESKLNNVLKLVINYQNSRKYS